MDPQEPTPSPAEDALRRLEARLDRASEAAERMIAEATAAAGSEPPPAGWQIPSDKEPHTSRDDLDLLVGIVNSVRELIPPDLQRRLAEALRELLMALRALIDWYLERSERRRGGPSEVQDIPIS